MGIRKIVLNNSGYYFEVGFNCSKIQDLSEEYHDHVNHHYDIMQDEKTVASIINCPVVVYYQ